jgi:hypothetical protein
MNIKIVLLLVLFYIFFGSVALAGTENQINFNKTEYQKEIKEFTHPSPRCGRRC